MVEISRAEERESPIECELKQKRTFWETYKCPERDTLANKTLRSIERGAKRCGRHCSYHRGMRERYYIGVEERLDVYTTLDGGIDI